MDILVEGRRWRVFYVELLLFIIPDRTKQNVRFEVLMTMEGLSGHEAPVVTWYADTNLSKQRTLS
jgi:hypothetical protein